MAHAKQDSRLPAKDKKILTSQPASYHTYIRTGNPASRKASLACPIVYCP